MAPKKEVGAGLGGLDAMFKDSARELRRAGRMCKKEGGGPTCAVFDMASLMVTGARGLAASSLLQGTTGDVASPASSSRSMMGEVKSATPLAEVTEAGEGDADDDA